MSSSIPPPACRIARHLVSAPSSSRIGYRMISQRNPSHTTSDTTTSRFRLRSSLRPISSPYCFPPRFPPNRVARRVGSRHDAILHATRLALVLSVCSPCFISSASSHLIGSSVPPVACLPRPTHAVAIHLIHLISLVSSHRLIAHISSPRQSDKTSDEQAKRRTEQAIDDGQGETPRHPMPYGYRQYPSPPTV